jgi:quinol monooxygenase YgiN
MNTHVCWMLEMQVREGRDDDFRALMAEMAAATEANEPGTLAYEWSLSADGRQCHLWERYADSAAALVHGATFGSRWAARFFDVLAPVRLVLYGSPSDEVKAALAPFSPVVMAPAAGFSR